MELPEFDKTLQHLFGTILAEQKQLLETILGDDVVVEFSETRRRGRVCAYPGCQRRIKAQYQLCYNHFQAASRYQWEHRSEWAVKDAKSNAFYVYILELSDGDFYAGQTRNLIRRVSEHEAGATQSTAGRKPRLAWFAQVSSRQEAVEKEADLKHLIDKQPGRVRRLIEEFRRR